MATSKASPAPASQAEKANRRIGAAEEAVDSSCRVHIARAMNRDSIIPSKHSRADKRWAR